MSEMHSLVGICMQNLMQTLSLLFVKLKPYEDIEAIIKFLCQDGMKLRMETNNVI